MASFRVVALAADQFAPLAALSDAELAAQGVRRVVVDDQPGYPCRVSLVDAEVGETVLLLSFVHHDVNTAYRAMGPIFVRPGVPTATPAIGEIPALLRHRLLSVRAFEQNGLLFDSRVVRGTELEATIAELLAQAPVAYLHLHNAGPGCFNCSVVRA